MNCDVCKTPKEYYEENIVMKKKIGCLIVIIGVVITVSIILFNGNFDSDSDNEVTTITGTITQIDSDWLQIKENPDVESYIELSIDDDTEIIKNSVSINIDDIVVEETIIVTYTGGIEETEPVRINFVKKIEIY